MNFPSKAALGLGTLALGAVVLSHPAAAYCMVPHTLHNTSVTHNTMSVTSGERCEIFFFSQSQTVGLQVAVRPKNGTVTSETGLRIVYVSRKGFVGRDSFTVVQTTTNARGTRFPRTVVYAVTVAAPGQ